MEELLQTEEAYIHDMQWVVDNYMPAMDDINNTPRNLVGKKNLIFSTIPQLLQFNKLWVSDLEGTQLVSFTLQKQVTLIHCPGLLMLALLLVL